MPKPMMMLVAVEEIAFGKVFRTLNTMDGVVGIKINADADAASQSTKQKRGTQKDGTSALCIVMRRIAADKNPVTPRVLGDVLEAAGYSRKTWGNIVAKFRDQKLAIKSPKGWRPTKKGVDFAKVCANDPTKLA